MSNPESPWYKDQHDPSLHQTDDSQVAPPAAKRTGLCVALIAAAIVVAALYYPLLAVVFFAGCVAGWTQKGE